MVPNLAWIDRLPVLRLSPGEFSRLGEYSCSLPTGTTPGKRWKRLDGSFDQVFKAAGGKPRWVVGEYDPADTNESKPRIKINWYRPVICLRAAARVVA